jgi:hypothetical protein
VKPRKPLPTRDLKSKSQFLPTQRLKTKNPQNKRSKMKIKRNPPKNGKTQTKEKKKNNKKKKNKKKTHLSLPSNSKTFSPNEASSTPKSPLLLLPLFSFFS